MCVGGWTLVWARKEGTERDQQPVPHVCYCPPSETILVKLSFELKMIFCEIFMRHIFCKIHFYEIIEMFPCYN